MSLRYSATIRGSSAHLVQGAGFTDSANKGIRSESQSTPVIRLAPSLSLTVFPRAFDCPDPSPDRQGGARGSAEVSGLALSLLRLPDESRPQPLRATLSRSGDRVEKARILDEFVNVTGYHRKHAMRLLRGTMGREEVVGRSAGFTVKPNAMRSHSSGKRRTGFAASG